MSAAQTFCVITNSIARDVSLVEKSLIASLKQPHLQEVIFVDQNAAPLKLNAEVSNHPNLRVIHCPVPAVSQARNSAPYPKVDWLIFCDDDGYMADQYLDSLLKRVQKEPEVDVFCGSIRRTDNGEFYSSRHAIGGDMSLFWNTKLLMGSNFAVKRVVFEELGKFDENFGAGARFGSSEETDFAWKAFFAEKRMRYAPELIVFHIPPFSGTAQHEIRKAFRYGKGKGALVRKWLLRGKVWAFFEFFEMVLVPLVKIVQYLFSLKSKQIAIQWSSLMGRVFGFFA